MQHSLALKAGEGEEEGAAAEAEEWEARCARGARASWPEAFNGFERRVLSVWRFRFDATVRGGSESVGRMSGRRARGPGGPPFKVVHSCGRAAHCLARLEVHHPRGGCHVSADHHTLRASASLPPLGCSPPLQQA